MAQILNFEKAFWLWGAIINRLPELECDDRILGAVHDEKRHARLFESCLSMELSMNEKLDAGQKPEELARQSRSRRERRLQYHGADRQSRRYICRYRRPQRLPEGNDRFRIDSPDFDQVCVSRFRIEINARLGGFAFAVPVSPIFQCQDVCRSAV